MWGLAVPHDPSWRAASEHETALLEKLLAADFLGADSLRVQQATMLVSEIPEEPRNGSLELHPRPNSKALAITKRVPVEAQGTDVDGVPFHVLLFVVDGLMAELQIFREDSRPLLSQPVLADMEVLVLG